MGRIAGASLANQVRAAASAIFSWAIEQELVPTNPCHGVKRNATQSRERVLAPAELPAVWAALDEHGMAGVALKVLLLTGQRPGEVAHNVVHLMSWFAEYRVASGPDHDQAWW